MRHWPRRLDIERLRLATVLSVAVQLFHLDVPVNAGAGLQSRGDGAGPGSAFVVVVVKVQSGLKVRSTGMWSEFVVK